MPRKKKDASTKDVAALAGVSVGTVSNVLNAPHKVSEATQSRVLAAIEQLGWEPNENARQLRAGRSNTVGMVVMDIANPYFADLFRGAEEALLEAGYSVYIGNSDQDYDREVMLLEHFRRSQVGGVLLAPMGTELKSARVFQKKGIPVVLVDRTNSDEFCQVGVDDFAGGKLAANHLAEQGHKRVAFIGGPESLSQVQNRLQGARAALAESQDVSLLVFPTVALDVEAGKQAALDVLNLPSGLRPTAVFCANDLIAIGMLQGMVAAGIRVPEEMAIIGYDDIVFAAAAAVPLSSIRQPKAEMGREAARILIESIRQVEAGTEPELVTRVFTPALVERASTIRS